jgi:signal transduction histidine kinase
MSQPEARAMGAERHLFARRKDGSEFPVDISLHPIEIQQRHMVLAYVLDATDRRRAERDREQQQAMERLAMLGQLAGGVAHEIRTPLCVIRNDAYFLKMMADKLGAEGIECVEEINQAVLKAERIVSELLDFTRDFRGEAQEAAIGKLVDAAVRAVAIPSTIEVVPKLGDEEIWIRVDPEQIERILINLIRNAAQALGDKGRIEIIASIRGAQLVLHVTDNGPGISPENLERVFEPLFTTKPQGIGLGLAVSRQYAKRNGGTLSVRNLEGAGTCFELTLPLAGHAP